MTVSSYKVFDSDMHVQEPWDLWLNYIEPEYRSQAPVGTNEYFTDVYLKHDGKLISRHDHQHTHEEGFVRDMCAQHGRLEIFEDYDERGWSSECQLDAMEREGIDVAVLFPTRGLFAHAKIYDDNRLAAAVSRAYNNWLVEFCSIAPERMYGAAMLPVQDVGAAVAEARRAKEELGFPAVFIRPNPVRGRNWHDPIYDPLWAECERLGLAVGFHEGIPCELPVAVGERFDGRHEELWITEHVACHPIEMMYASLAMINGGVCERFPELRLGFLEANCSWVPYWLWRMDEHYEHLEKTVKDQIKRRPSEYFARQCYVSVEADEAMARHVFEDIGDANVVFSTDFPHPDSRFPNAVETLLEQPFPKESIGKILWDNCARFYGFT